MTDEFWVIGEVGKCIRCTVKNDAGDGTGPVDFDVQSFTTLEIEFLSPQHTITAKTATLVAGTTNKIEYITDATFPENNTSNVGVWHRRAHVQKAGSDFYGSWIETEVRK